MKKILALFLAVIMMLGTFVACNSANNSNGTESQDGEQTGSDSSQEEEIDNKNKITFGSYPQSEVVDETLKATLTSAAGALPTSENVQNWKSYGYYADGSNENAFMWYIDIEQGTEKYRGVYFTSYRTYYFDQASSVNNSVQDDNGYLINNVYWFKYEPISWTILNENATDGTALILCDMIIDAQAYQIEYVQDNLVGTYYNTSEGVPSGTYANNYAYSTIRKWLNDTFYNTAFDELQKQAIVNTIVDNSAATTDSANNKYACENTQDNVFLLSYQDIENADYGFTDYQNFQLGKATALREKKTTAYARAQGAYAYRTVKNSPKYDNGSWRLRSPSSTATGMNASKNPVYSYAVHANESILAEDWVYSTTLGVAPALWVKR